MAERGTSGIIQDIKAWCSFFVRLTTCSKDVYRTTATTLLSCGLLPPQWGSIQQNFQMALHYPSKMGTAALVALSIKYFLKNFQAIL